MATIVKTTAFLELCGGSVRMIFEYWNDKRAGHKLPLRADIDPSDLRPYLPTIMIVEVLHEPLRFRYRLVGTQEVEAAGGDPTGRKVGEQEFAGDGAAMHGHLDYVATSGSFLYDREPISIGEGQYVRMERLFLPLSHDHETVSQILVFSTYQEAKTGRPWRPKFRS